MLWLALVGTLGAMVVIGMITQSKTKERVSFAKPVERLLPVRRAGTPRAVAALVEGERVQVTGRVKQREPMYAPHSLRPCVGVLVHLERPVPDLGDENGGVQGQLLVIVTSKAADFDLVDETGLVHVAGRHVEIELGYDWNGPEALGNQHASGSVYRGTAAEGIFVDGARVTLTADVVRSKKDGNLWLSGSDGSPIIIQLPFDSVGTVTS